MAYMALYVLGKDVETLTDFDIKQDINRRCSSVKNSHLPDVEALFAEGIQMDLKEDDIEARLLKCFARFNKSVGNYGLQNVMRHTETKDHNAVVIRTKILIDNLAPKILKREIEQLVTLEYCKDKVDEGALDYLMLKRARAQQHYFLTVCTKQDTCQSQSSYPNVKGSLNRDETPQPPRERPSKPATFTPPRDGCLVCKGPQ
uniref:Uncharacterized protein n=1 Tax=Hyaloperonospora arabidopsidis (strain Emoy2) TaxID=559515 RepID=M4BGH0_HYAAE